MFRQKKIRIRRSVYELLNEISYRIKLILLNKNNELGPLTPELQKSLSNLLSSLRDVKTEIEAKALINEENVRSKELDSILYSIEQLEQCGVLTIKRQDKAA